MVIGIAPAASQMQVIPVDPEVRIGQLDNGMTYILRHNPKPEGMAEFYLVTNVGALQEEDSQIGLAHFLEHMAFNGTENFPGKTIINYLETIGVRFGANLNAGTGVELTYYQLSQVPLRREAIIDSVLLILHDWSHLISLDPEEVDNERGVIIEELRTGRNAAARVRDRIMPIVYNGSRYSYRNIIGTEEQLRTFPLSELREFYHRWYRPDLQAVIIVGDFDVDMMEERVIDIMSRIPAVENPELKQFHPIPDNEKPLVAVETDPELTGSSVTLYIKRPAIPVELRNTVQVRFIQYALAAAGTMTSTRLAEMAQKPGAPFLVASFSSSAMSVSNDALVGSVMARDGEIPTAFEALMTEIERVRRFGFNESELERFKTNTLERSRQAYLRHEDRRSGDMVQGLMQHFLTNRSFPSAEMAWKLDSALITSLSTEIINKLMSDMITSHNNVVVVTAPERDDTPTTEQMLAILEQVRTADIEPFEDTVITEPLIAHEITPGSVVKSEAGMFDSTIWTLSNGVRVILKPTDLRKEQFAMSAVADGGLSTVSDADYRTAQALMGLAGISGVGNFSSTELSRALTGKVATASPSLDRFNSSIAGSSSRRDAETMLQLTYLYFTQPRFARDDFDRMTDLLRATLANAENTPAFWLQQESSQTLYGDHPRAKALTLARLDEIDFDRMKPLYEKFFKDKAGSYTFFFIGDFDLAELQPLVEKYLGSLPTGREKLAWSDDGLKILPGERTNRFSVEMQTPKTTVRYVYSGDIENTQENRLAMNMLQRCLDLRYMESIREEKGGTYGVSVSGGLGRRPRESYSLQVGFDTDPELVDELVGLVEAELRHIAEHGPREDDMSKTFEHWQKSRPEQLLQNGTWLGYLQGYYLFGEDNYTGYDAALQAVTADKVRDLARKILADGNLVRLVMMPK